MPTEPVVVFPEDDVFRSVQYTGTNAAEINTLIADFTVTNETATHLTFTSGGASYTVPHNSYLVYQNGAVTDTYLNQQDFQQAFHVLAAAAQHYHEVILTSGPALPGAPPA